MLNNTFSVNWYQMRKPPTGSSESLTAKSLLETMKKKQRWTNKEILAELLPKYTAYDRDGLYHKIRQTLSYLTKEEKIERVGKGIYKIPLT